MKLLGFNFTKISIEKKKDSLKDLKIENQVDITNVSEVNQDVLKSDDDFLAVTFKYVIDYKPEIARIEMVGSVLLSINSKIAKEVLKKWKGQDTPDEFRIPLFNVIFRKAGLKALELEDQLNLPLHMQMPAIRKDDLKTK